MKNKIKKLAVTTALLATLGTGVISTYSAQAQEQESIEQALKMNDSEKVAEFKSQKQLKKLLKKYPVYVRDSVVKSIDLGSSNEDFSLNDEKYLSLNNNQKPRVNFKSEEKFDLEKNNYDFKVEFAQNEDYLQSNHLSGHSFSYKSEIPESFLNSDIYKKLEGKQEIQGYINWDRESSTYYITVMQYQFENEQLDMTFKTLGNTNYSKIALSDFEVNTGVKVIK